MDFDEDRGASPGSVGGKEGGMSQEFGGRKLAPLSYNISLISRRSRHRAGTSFVLTAYLLFYCLYCQFIVWFDKKIKFSKIEFN